MSELPFSFSDTIAGYVTWFDQDHGRFGLRTSKGHEFTVTVTQTMSVELVRNLNEPYVDASSLLTQGLAPGRFLFVYGVFYPEGDSHTFEAKRLVFVGKTANDYVF